MQGYQCAGMFKQIRDVKIVLLILNLVCKVLVHKRCHRNVITSCGDKGRAQSLIVKADEVCKLFTLLYNLKPFVLVA